MSSSSARRRDLFAILLLLLLPAILLVDSVLLGRHYLPYDIAEYPPIADTLTVEQRRELQATANYDATEAPIWFAVELQFAREALAHGELPHWNSYVRGGAPMLAHGHMGLLNPLHWPALLFPDPADGLLCLTYLMFALAGTLMFGLLRTLGLATASALFGACVFEWSGTLTANGHWFMRMEPLALLPGGLWALLAIARARGRARALPSVGLAAATAGIWLSGFPQYGIPVSLILALTAITLGLRAWRTDKLLLLWFAAGAGLGLMLAMAQLLPMFSFYPLSNRPIDESLDRATRHAWAPMGFLGYVFPQLFSHPGDTSLPTEAAPLPWLWSDLRHWQTGEQLLPNYNFTEYAVYIGLLPLTLAVLALILRGPRWRWLAAAGLAGIWLCATGALGTYAIYHLPGIKTVPPYRFAGPACALIAMLSALGLEAVRREGSQRILRAVGVVLLVAAGALLLGGRSEIGATTVDDPWLARIVERYRSVYAQQAGVPPEAVTPAVALQTKFTLADNGDPARPRDVIRNGKERLQSSILATNGNLALLALLFLAASLLPKATGFGSWPAAMAIALTAWELFDYGFALNRGQRQPFPHDSPVHAFLRQQRDQAKDAGGFLVARGAGAYGPWCLPGGTIAKEHIRDLNFYTFVDSRSDQPIRKLYGDAFILRGFVCNAFPDDERLSLPWWDLMGLRYIVATQPMQHAGKEIAVPGGNGNTKVYERPTALPRAWVVPELQIVADAPATDPTPVGRRVTPAELTAVLATDFAPRERAVLTASEAATLPQLARDPAAKGRGIHFAQQDEKRLTLNVDAGPAGYLVLADTHMPGWTVEIDNKPVPLARGNVYQRVVALPAGACTVAFRYRTPGLLPGLGLTAVAAVALLTLLFVGIRARRGMPPVAG